MNSQSANSQSANAQKGIFLERWHETVAIAETQTEDWFWDGWCEFGCLHLLSGLPFGGKSTFIAELLGANVKNIDYCNLGITQCPFILFDLENKEKILVKRLNRALEGHDEKMEELYRRVGLGHCPRPLTVQYVRACVEELKKSIDFKYGLIIVDTLRSAFGIDELDPQEIYNLCVPFKELAAELHLAIIILIHNAKYSNSYSGNTALAGVADYLWNCQKDADKLSTKLKWEGRGDVMPDLCLAYSLETKRLTYTGTVKEEKAKEYDFENDKKLYQIAKHLNYDYLISAAEIQKEMGDKPPSTKTILRWLINNYERGFFYKEDTARGLVFKLTQDGVNWKVSMLVLEANGWIRRQST